VYRSGGRRSGDSSQGRLSGMARHPTPPARSGDVPPQDQTGREPPRPLRLAGHRNGQDLQRGQGRRAQGHRGSRVGMRPARHHAGRLADERLHGVRHGHLPRAPWSVRRDRSVELPGDDPDGLDDAPRSHHREHLRPEGRLVRAADLLQDGGTRRRVRPTGRCAQRGHLLPPRGRAPADPPRCEGREFRRFQGGRPACVPDRHRGRQASAIAHRSEKPRSRAAGCPHQGGRPADHQLGIRVRRRALHGTARHRRRGRDR